MVLFENDNPICYSHKFNTIFEKAVSIKNKIIYNLITTHGNTFTASTKEETDNKTFYNVSILTRETNCLNSRDNIYQTLSIVTLNHLDNIENIENELVARSCINEDEKNENNESANEDEINDENDTDEQVLEEPSNPSNHEDDTAALISTLAKPSLESICNLIVLLASDVNPKNIRFDETPISINVFATKPTSCRTSTSA